MVFTVLAVRGPDSAADDLYPQVGAGGTVVLEPGDGAGLVWRRAERASVDDVGASGTSHLEGVHGGDVDFVVTAGRLLVVCAHWVHVHPGWGIGVLGASISAARTLQKVSRAHDEERDRLKTGHLRHRWIRHISWTQETDGAAPRVSATVMVRSDEGGLQARRLALTLPRHVDPQPIALSAVAAVARNRLDSATAGSPLSDEKRAACEALLSPSVPEPRGSGHFVLGVPGWRHVQHERG